MSDHDDAWDAIVIGAGLGGLSTAAYLSTNGKRTLVLEQADRVGGCTHVFRRRGRWEFDVGVHYTGGAGPGTATGTVLQGLGLADRIEHVQLDPDGFDTLVFPDLTFRVPASWDRYLERLIEAFPDEERGLRRCIRILRRIADTVYSRRPTGPLGRLAALPALLQLTWWMRRSQDALFDACRLGPGPRAVITAQNGSYATPPSKAPVLMQAGLLEHYFKQGAYYPKGGGQVYAGHLVDVIHSNGGAVRTGARVAKILVGDGRVTGIRLMDGTELDAPVVVSNADLKRTYLELLEPDTVSEQTLTRVRGYRMAPPMFSVYLGLDIDLRDRMPATNYWVHPQFGTEQSYQDAAAGREPENWFVFVSSASVKDPGNPHIAPPGHSTMEILAVVPSDYEFWGVTEGPAGGGRYSNGEKYRAVKERLIDSMIERAEQVVPGLRDHIVWREGGTPLTQERYTLASAGSSYSIELSVGQFGPSRPDTRTEIDGLFLTGASLRWGHGIAGALSSGLGAASAVLDRDLRREILDGQVFGDPGVLTAGGEDWDPLEACRKLSGVPRSGQRRTGRTPQVETPSG